jgi:hypothetical protein
LVRGNGSVNFAPAQVGNGAYFLSCCDNTNTAFYKFTGATIGNIFNVNQGQITFYLKSRYSFANRVALAPKARVAFAVTDADPSKALFFFASQITQVGTENYLLFSWRVGNGFVNGYTTYFLWVDPSAADTLFGNGVILKVTLTWNGVTNQLYFNDVLQQTNTYAPVTPNWTAASIFDMGAVEDLTYGAFNVNDDIINQFTVRSQ